MPHPASSKLTRILFGALAYISLAIGLIAIVVPGLPTTEFILLAAWAATKSSPRLSAWLENHRLFGPILSNWRNGKIVARRAKVSATVSMLLCAGTDAGHARSWLAGLPRHRRHEPGQSVDLVATGISAATLLKYTAIYPVLRRFSAHFSAQTFNHDRSSEPPSCILAPRRLQ